MRYSMPMPRNLLLWGPLFLVLSAVPARAGSHAYAVAGEKPDDPSFVYDRTVFDCQPPDQLTVELGSSFTLADSTIGRPTLINGYPCAAWSETGPELIYRLDVVSDLQLTAVLSTSTFDLDLFLLNDCDSDSCLVGASTSFIADLEADTYYLIVDTAGHPPANRADTFTLELTTRAQGLPAEACTAAEAAFVTCLDDTFSLPEIQDLFGQPNLVGVYDCGTSPKNAGENWYALAQGPSGQVDVTVGDVVPGLDVNLWLFAGCGPEAVCLQFVDSNLSGLGETLTWTNEDETENVTVYLAVDAIRETVPPEGQETAPMTYSIRFECQGSVPVAETSLGSLKSLYR